MLTTIYAREPLPRVVTKSLFLAGPTPRGSAKDLKRLSWREEALNMLEGMGYEGHVFVPEPRDGKWAENYEGQVEWEDSALNMADCIVFWVPRDMTGEAFYGCPMAGLTTNDEWGHWKDSGKVVWGAPGVAQHVRYQSYYANKLGVPGGLTLKDTLQTAVSRLGEGARRADGCCQVPLHIWNKPEFQAWLQSQQAAGNRLDGCRVLWTFWVGKDRGFLFSWALHVNVWVGSENRAKTNEYCLFRSDIAAVVLYSSLGGSPHHNVNLMEAEVVLVREFRSPVRNSKGFVFECPGGSSKSPEKAQELALHEVEEETGLKLAPERLRPAGTRQIGATLSAHVATVFVARLTEAEMQTFRQQIGPRGVVEDSERTYVEVSTVQDLLQSDLVDWATLGMVFAGLHS